MNKKPLKITICDDLKLITGEHCRYHIGMNSVLTNFIFSSKKRYIRVKKKKLDHLVRHLFQINEEDVTVIADKFDKEKIDSLIKIGDVFKTVHILDSIDEYDDGVFVVLNFTEDDVEVFVDIQSFRDFKGNSPQYRELFDSIFAFPEKIYERGHSRDVW